MPQAVPGRPIFCRRRNLPPVFAKEFDMSLFAWLPLLKRQLPIRNRQPRSAKPGPRFFSQFMQLEDRCLLSIFVPMLPNAGTAQHSPKGLNTVLYTPEGDPTFDKKNLPAAKLVTLENNSS